MKGSDSVQFIALITTSYHNRIALMESALTVTITGKRLFAHHGETSAWKSWWCFILRLFFENNLNRNDDQVGLSIYH